MVRAADTKYRVIVCDLRSDQLLDVLPISGVSFNDYIGKTGVASGTVEITDPRVADRIRTNTTPARTAMYLVRGNSVWWGGVLWTRTPQSDSRGFMSVGLQASTFDSYFAARRLFEDRAYVQDDQLSIARNLLDYAQSQPGGDIGLTYDLDLSGVLRDRSYIKYDHSDIRDLVDKLSQVDNGFEWRTWAFSDTTGRRVKRMQFGYPKIRSGTNDLVISLPGRVVGYSLPEDGTTTANVWQSRGASINNNLAEDSYPILSDLFTFADDIDVEGWPRLDGSSDYSTVEQVDTLNDHARADIQRYRHPVVIPSVTVLLGDNVTPALIGSSLKLRIKDIWYPNGFAARYRIVGFQVKPPERGQPETAQLYLEPEDLVVDSPTTL